MPSRGFGEGFGAGGPGGPVGWNITPEVAPSVCWVVQRPGHMMQGRLLVAVAAAPGSKLQCEQPLPAAAQSAQHASAVVAELRFSTPLHVNVV